MQKPNNNNRLFRTHYLLSFIFAATLLSCARKHNRDTVVQAMQQYDRLIMKLDADSISLLYTPDGRLGEIAQGRDSIKKFLSSFKNVQVLSQSSSTSSIIITGDTAIQKGDYTQTDVIAEKDTVKVKGTYTATWLWLPENGWHIKQMTTSPSK